MNVTTASTSQSSDSSSRSVPQAGVQENARHPGEDDDREDRLGARVHVDLVVVAERDEDVRGPRRRRAARGATTAAPASGRRPSR